MEEDTKRRSEMQVAMQQIRSAQSRQTRTIVRQRVKKWRLDVPMTKMAIQGILTFGVGILVGLGAFVLYSVVFT